MRESLSSRFVLVVGKGGVGKTTTSAALALHMADEGLMTHLLSTDPAHSLGDLFEEWAPSAAPTSSPCSPALTLEELDTATLAGRWLFDVREAVSELFDRGTYLDREDVGAFLDRSLPGMDEVMAAMRMADLAHEKRHDRIVVDTAPTGHTLRLLRCGQTVQGWVHALEMMAAKAGAVGEAFAGRRIRFAGERVIEELSAKIGRFEQAMRAETDVVVVTRDGEVVTAETCRLIGELGRLGLHVRALVRVGGGTGRLTTDGVPVFEVAWGGALEGCRGLRRWGAEPAPATDRGEPSAGSARMDSDGPGTAEPAVRDTVAPTRPCAEALAALAVRELIFFAGKGGVGKTTCAAAFALAAARERDVLLLGLDPAGSLGDVIGRPVGADGLRLGRLEIRQLDADDALRRFRERYRQQVREAFERLGLHDSAALDRQVVESILDMAPPGVDEIFALDAILDGQEEHRLLVLDTAPTGHFLGLLAMPETLLSWTRSVLRILLRYRSALGLDDFAGDVLGFAKRLRALVERLADARRTGVVVVTLAEPLPRLETGRLLRALERNGTPVAAVLENRWVPRPDGGLGETAPGGPPFLRAPAEADPPVGTDRLEAFVAGWACA